MTIAYIIIAIAIGAVIIGVRVAYAYRTPQPAPAVKPVLAFMPVYRLRLPLPESFVRAPAAEARLITVLSECGFVIDSENEAHIKFVKAKSSGLFRDTPVLLILHRPLGSPTTLDVRYATGQLFDRGTLWHWATGLFLRLSCRACYECGYDLRGSAGRATCPECGARQYLWDDAA